MTCRYSKRTNQMVLMLCVSIKGIAEKQWTLMEEELTTMLQGLTNADIDNDGVQGGSNGHFVRGLCVQVDSYIVNMMNNSSCHLLLLDAVV